MSRKLKLVQNTTSKAFDSTCERLGIHPTSNYSESTDFEAVMSLQDHIDALLRTYICLRDTLYSNNVVPNRYINLVDTISNKSENKKIQKKEVA